MACQNKDIFSFSFTSGAKATKEEELEKLDIPELNNIDLGDIKGIKYCPESKTVVKYFFYFLDSCGRKPSYCTLCNHL